MKYESTVTGLKPMTVNRAFHGRRFPTKEYQQYKHDLGMLLTRKRVMKGNVEIVLVFGLPKISFSRSDVSNLIKATEDAIVEAGLIEDDAKVLSITASKYLSDDYIVQVTINPLP